MSRTLVVILFAVLVAASVLVQSASAQCTPPAMRTWVIFADAGTGRDTLWFGHDPAATYGLNTPLCEMELPPGGPGGVFDVRWVNIPGHEGEDTYPLGNGMGQGFKQDYRAYVSPAKIDTHRVDFKPGLGGTPFTLSWSTSGVLAICDSAILQDMITGTFITARMHVVNSLTVTSGAITSLLLIRYGQVASGVDPVGDVLPSEYALAQNFPNPFNPSTAIQFSVPRLAQTDVAVFDVLGRRVATLVSEQLAPHTYKVVWEGKNDQGASVASGMYLLRMDAIDESGAKFSATRKLVLMK